MLEEREVYLEETEDYANGFYNRDLLPALGEVKGIKGASGKERRFPSRHTSRKKAGLDLAKVVISKSLCIWG